MIYTLTLNPSLDYHVKVDDLNMGSLNVASSNAVNAGGKGINVSKVLHTLNTPTTAIAVLAGFTGKAIQQELQALGVSTKFIEVNGLNRINVKLHNLRDGTETEINGAPLSFREDKRVELQQYLNSTLVSGDMLVLSGSLLPDLKKDFYKTVAQSLPSGVRTVLDTRADVLVCNIHNNFLIKPNISELEGALGKKCSSLDEIIAGAETFLNLGVENVIVSMGQEGSILVNQNQRLHAQPMRIQVCNSVGAGDSMVAGFLAATEKGSSIEEAYKLSIACALATLANVDTASAHDINSFLQQINIQQI